MAVNLYLEGCGFRRIARILSNMFEKHFCYQTVIQWIKKEAKKQESAELETKEETQILEMDELYTYIKKSNKIRVWTAVDRNALRFAAFEVGDASGQALKKILNELSYCFISTICTDANFAYDKFIPKSIQHCNKIRNLFSGIVQFSFKILPGQITKKNNVLLQICRNVATFCLSFSS